MVPDREAGRAQSVSAGDAVAETPLGESRWPPIIAVLVFMALNIGARVWLPGEGSVHVPWLVPAIEGALLVVLLASDPSGLAERQRMRRVALILVDVLVFAALWATVGDRAPRFVLLTIGGVLNIVYGIAAIGTRSSSCTIRTTCSPASRAGAGSR